MNDVYRCDVLVVGGGAAGMRAALEAHLQGAHVVLAVKGGFSAIGVRGAGASAGGLCNASGMLYAHREKLHAEPEEAYKEALQLGLGLADPRLVRILIQDSIRNRAELARYNIVWPHHTDRGVRAHGVPITSGLAAQIAGRGIEVRENTTIFHLLVHNGQCVGAVGMNENTGKVTAFSASAVILATGGDGQLFRHNLNASCVTGDGYALGYEAGAALTNLEFMQVFIAIIHPTRNNLQIWNWGKPPVFLNSEGKEFLQDYCPTGVEASTVLKEHNRHDPASTRDQYSRYLEVAITQEVIAGRGTPRGGVWMDFRGMESQLDRRAVEWLHYRGIDSEHDCIEVSVSHQCSNGGFVADEHAQTTLPGLYAVGETMGGAWGADRRGGFMLAATQVFGARAGQAAARQALDSPAPAAPQAAGLEAALEELQALKSRKGTQSPADLKRTLQQVNWESLLFDRSDASLRRVLNDVALLRAEFDHGLRLDKPFNVAEAFEFRNMLTVSEMVARACLMRTESRGGHYRSDYPERSDEVWTRNIRIQKRDGSMALEPFHLDGSWHESQAGENTSYRWG